MTDLFIFSILVVFVIYGLQAPYIAIMGYIWVDSIKPQSLAYGFMADKPLSMIMAILCILSFAFHIKTKVAHHSKGILSLLILFSLWVTLTTVFSLYPDLAWIKWNDSIKVILFSMLIPFYISNKSQLEAIMVAFCISMSVFVLAVGVKTIFGGGGYGVVLIPGDSGVLSESSTFSAFTVMVVPFYIFISRHSLLFVDVPFKKIMMIGAVILSVLANVGSGARTGLIGLVILFVKLFLETKRKFTLLFFSVLVVGMVMSYTSDSWYERMNTMTDVESEGSAMGRIMVWKWTLGFALENPLGGGFISFIANRGQLNEAGNNNSLAFHSIYFEVLGEHGYFGLFIYLLLIIATLLKLGKLKKESNDDWVKDAASALRVVIIVFCACGTFIGIAFQPTLYLMIAYTVCLYNLHVENVKKEAIDVT